MAKPNRTIDLLHTKIQSGFGYFECVSSFVTDTIPITIILVPYGRTRSFDIITRVLLGKYILGVAGEPPSPPGIRVADNGARFFDVAEYRARIKPSGKFFIVNILAYELHRNNNNNNNVMVSQHDTVKTVRLYRVNVTDNKKKKKM